MFTLGMRCALSVIHFTSLLIGELCNLWLGASLTFKNCYYSFPRDLSCVYCVCPLSLKACTRAHIKATLSNTQAAHEYFYFGCTARLIYVPKLLRWGARSPNERSQMKRISLCAENGTTTWKLYVETCVMAGSILNGKWILRTSTSTTV